jgi:hypothetical protein
MTPIFIIVIVVSVNHAIADDHALLRLACALAHCGAGCRSDARSDYRAVTTAELAADRGPRRAPDRTANDRIAALIEVCASSG